jgi:hypothetical protein
MTGYWSFRTRKGEFRIVPRDDGAFDVWFEGYNLDGPFITPAHAAEEIANGHCLCPSGIDPERLGVPGDFTEWELVIQY